MYFTSNNLGHRGSYNRVMAANIVDGLSKNSEYDRIAFDTGCVAALKF